MMDLANGTVCRDFLANDLGSNYMHGLGDDPLISSCLA